MITSITEANMNDSRHFTSRIAFVFAAVALVGTSAFADSRHPKTTESRAGGRATIQRDRAEAPAPARVGRQDSKQSRPVVTSRSDARQARPVIGDRSDRFRKGGDDRGSTNGRTPGRGNEVNRPREESRRGSQQARPSNGSRGGSWDRGNDRPAPSYGSQQARPNNNGSRGESWDRGNNDRRAPSYGSQQAKRAPYYAHGRVSKIHPHGNGYRVWVHGAAYPFFVPMAYYHRGHFNVGMTIRVGGYYNPRGYYDYYGDYASNAIAGEALRGVVESVDYRRGEFVMNLAGRGGYVTVLVPDRGERIWEGAYVVVYGDWGRGGRFIAGNVDVIDDRYRW